MDLSRIFAVKQQLHTNVAKMHVTLNNIRRHTDGLYKVLDDRPGLHDDLLNCMNSLNECLNKWSMCIDVARLKTLVGNSNEPLTHTNKDWIVDENVLNEPPCKRQKIQQMRHSKLLIPDQSTNANNSHPKKSPAKSAAANSTQDQYVPVSRQTVKTNGPQLGEAVESVRVECNSAALTSAKQQDSQYSKDQSTSSCPAAVELVGPQLSETVDPNPDLSNSDPEGAKWSEEDAFELVVKLSNDNDGNILAKKDIATLSTTITDHFVTHDLWLSTENARHLAGSIKKYYPQESVEKWTTKLLHSFRYKKQKHKNRNNVWQRCIIIGNCVKAGGDALIDVEQQQTPVE